MLKKNSNKSLLIELNIDRSRLQDKIKSLHSGVKRDEGTYYSDLEDDQFRIFLNGVRGNAFSPVYKFEIIENEQENISILGRFLFRTFTLNLIFFWLFVICYAFFVSIKSMFIHLVESGNPGDYIYLFIFTLLLLGIFSFSIFMGKSRFLSDRELIHSFLREYMI